MKPFRLSEKMRAAVRRGKPLREIAEPRQGLDTGNNARFTRFWWEVSDHNLSSKSSSREAAISSQAKWFPFNKGGQFRKWYGNVDVVVNWHSDGKEIRNKEDVPGARPQGMSGFFLPQVTWSAVSSGAPSFRLIPPGTIFGGSGTSVFAKTRARLLTILALANSSIALDILTAMAPTLNFEVGQISSLPTLETEDDASIADNADGAVAASQKDWDSFETSPDFVDNQLILTNRCVSERN
jgi:hypothetical protein